MLQTIFTQLLGKYTSDENLIKQFWSEIEDHYSSKGRHYHTLQHLQNMYSQLQLVEEKMLDWNTVLFALFYHDLIYKSTAKDNEEQSAVIAVNRLQQIQYPAEKAEQCKQMILATKSHSISTNTDINYFTDADLSILGADWPEYEAYTKAIRKEYSIYPDLLYKPGRRKVLQHFLDMKSIYKTEFSQNKYEAIARENIQRELQLLR